MNKIRFYFSEVDVELTGWEFLRAVVGGILLCAAPFIIKAILLALGY